MVVDRSGDRQSSTQSRKKCILKVEELVSSNTGPGTRQSLGAQHNKSSFLAFSNKENLCPELTKLSCFRGQSFSPHKKLRKPHVFDPQSNRSKHNDKAGTRGSVTFSSRHKDSLRTPCSQVKRGTEGVSGMTLPGLLINADEMTLDGISGLVGHKEAIAWNGFAPLQKVLVVAVTAAAATAAKQKYSKEMRNLQRAMNLQDKDLETLRVKVGQLQEHLSFWRERAQNSFIEAKESAETENRKVSTENNSSFVKFGFDSTPRCDPLMLEQMETPQIRNALEKMPENIACLRNNSPAGSFRESLSFGGKIASETCDEDKHEIATFLDRLSESPLFSGGQFCFSPPELSSRKAAHGNQCHQKQCRNRAEDSSAPAIQCADPVLQPKNAMRHIQGRETQDLMAVLASVKERVQTLESTTSKLTDLSCSHPIKRAIIDLQDAIDQALAKAALLRRSMDGLCHLDEGSINEIGCLDMMAKRKKNADGTIIFNQICTKEQEEDRAKVDSNAFQLVDKSNVHTTLTCLCGRNQRSNDDWSSEMVIDQRLEELEGAGPKTRSASERQIEGFVTKLDETTCKELDAKVRLLEDAEKRLARCTEAIKRKDKAISMLENENASLQEMVSELRTIQITPKVLTSNLLFNLDSPVKMESPQRKNPFCSYRRLDEALGAAISPERQSMKSTCNSKLSKSEAYNQLPHTESYGNPSACGLQATTVMYAWDGDDRMLHADGYKSESGCLLQGARGNTGYKKTTSRKGPGKNHGVRGSGEEDGCGSSRSSSTNELLQKSGSTRSSSDNSSCGSAAIMQEPRLPRSFSSHVRRLKVTGNPDLRVSGDNGRSQTTGEGRHQHADRKISLCNSSKAGSMVGSIELSTPLRARNLCTGTKEKSFGHSVDSMTKAKENVSQRRRWI